MLRLTECSWIGIVMISMTSSTSITSISGVVLMSIITSGSFELPPEPTFMAMFSSSWALAAHRRLGDEADLGDAGALAGVDDAADRVVVGPVVAADVDLGLRVQHRDLLQPVDQRRRVRELEVVPVDVAGDVHRDRDVLGLGLADLDALLRELELDRRRDDRD